MTEKPRRRARVAAIVSAALLAGGGAGAGIYAAVAPGGSATAPPVTPVAATPAARSSAQLTVSQIYNRNAKGVVEIEVSSTATSHQPYPYGGQREQTGQGTGFVYDDKGDIVTNQHVVDGADTVKVKFADGSTYDATVVGTDASTDLAVIHVNAPAAKLHPLTLGDSKDVVVGEGVVAIGSPFGLENTVTGGIVSAVGREISAPDDSPIEDAIQTDAAINHGNSGGPLFDLDGDVIGVTAQIESDSGGNEGVGFAIPSETVKRVVPELIDGGTIAHAQLGVTVSSTSSGVTVESVQVGSGAAKAGIRAGDTIAKLGGTSVATAQELRSAIGAHKPGDTVEVTVERNGETKTLKAKLATRSS